MERLFKNGFVTTVLGIVILGFAGYMWYSGKATNVEATMWAGYGFIFLRSKDSLIGISKKNEA